MSRGLLRVEIYGPDATFQNRGNAPIFAVDMATAADVPSDPVAIPSRNSLCAAFGGGGPDKFKALITVYPNGSDVYLALGKTPNPAVEPRARLSGFPGQYLFDLGGSDRLSFLSVG